ncbi:MAG: Fe-S cluster assembly protein NifU [Cyanobacteriota bacterium]
MWHYTEKVQDLYRNPKNVGEVDNPDATGEVGSLACGDSMKLTLKIESGKIIEAKFLTFGCGSAVASASALTEMIIGKTVEEAKKITNKDIVNFLGGLPDEKMHCSVMGQEALEAAFNNYEGTEGQENNLTDPIICKCFGVHESKIREVIRENNLTSIDEVTNYCKAGGGCGLCDKEIVRLISEERELTPIRPRSLANLTKAQQIMLVDELMSKFIAVELRKDGGDIELVDIKDSKIYVKLRGACQGCRSSQVTLKNFVEFTLQEHIQDKIEIVEIID